MSSARPQPDLARGAVVAVVSAAAFGTSGSFGKSLLVTGWSSGAAVTARIALAALVLAVPTMRAMRGRWGELRAAASITITYGVVAVAACQLFYFNAVKSLSVGVALMLEYLGLVLVVGWVWLRDHQRPGPWTIGGVVASLFGLALVLDIFAGVEIDFVGVLWGLGAAVGLATYFVIAADDRTTLPPIALAGGGMVVGAITLGLAGLVGVLPMVTSNDDVALAGHDLPWWVSLLGLGVVAGAFSYATGIIAARDLGPRLAAFVGLTEVLFAVLIAWALLGELPRPIQLVGGAFIIGGVAAVRYESLSQPEVEAPPG